MDFQTICRVCISENLEMVSIFEPYNFSEVHYCDIFKVIADCASVQIQKLDGFSEKICRRCLNHLSQAYNFKKLCKESDYKFRNNLIASNENVIKHEFIEEDTIINYGEANNDIAENTNEMDNIRDFELIEVNQECCDDDTEAEVYNPLDDSTDATHRLGEVKREEVTVPDDVLEEARLATLDLLPAKSKPKYEKQLKFFNNWRESKNINGINEDIVLAYFRGMDTHKASTLWTNYSMLKATLQVYENVDISRFVKLLAYLKGKYRIHTPKKAKTLEKVHVERFLAEADDTIYLMKKIALIMGIFGACRCEELTNMCIDDIEDKGAYLLVTLPDTKTNKARKFTVHGDGYAVNVLDLYKKYASLRPENCQPVGINTLAKVPRDIASFLHLPDADNYTGHSFRRSSATLLANAGGDAMDLKRHSGWKSSTIAEEDSVANKLEIAKKIMGGKTSMPQSSLE